MQRFSIVLSASLLAGLSLALSACGDKSSDYDSQKSGTSTPSGTGAEPASGQPSKVDAFAGGYGYAAALGDAIDGTVGSALKKGKNFLLGRRDEATGSWNPTGPIAAGYTALGALAMIATTPKESVGADPTIRKALEFLKSKQRDNGAIYSNDGYINYETSVCLAAFAGARMADLSAAQVRARDYLLASQIQGSAAGLSYGGFPYTNRNDPLAPADLSNAQFAAVGLHDDGVAADNPVWAKFSTYLGRVQNRSETNATVIKRMDKDVKSEVEIVSGNDGGAGYGPGMSKAGLLKRDDGKYEVRSYGGMTYALVNCLLFAGAKADDPRVVAAVGWISKHFTVDRNPGFEMADDPAKKGQQGYYYYLLTMSRALAEYEKSTGKAIAVTDADRTAHLWRREVAAKLVSLQTADGSWKNPADRFEEGDPLIVSSYAIQALAICQGRLP